MENRTCTETIESWDMGGGIKWVMRDFLDNQDQPVMVLYSSASRELYVIRELDRNQYFNCIEWREMPDTSENIIRYYEDTDNTWIPLIKVDEDTQQFRFVNEKINGIFNPDTSIHIIRFWVERVR